MRKKGATRKKKEKPICIHGNFKEHNITRIYFFLAAEDSHSTRSLPGTKNAKSENKESETDPTTVTPDLLTKEKDVEEDVKEEEEAVVPDTLQSQKSTESVQVPEKQPVTTPVLETEPVTEPETEPVPTIDEAEQTPTVDVVETESKKEEEAVVPSSPTPVASSSTTSSSSSSAKQEERSYPATSSSSSAEPSTKSYWQHPQNEPMPQYSMGWPSLISIPEFQYNKPLPPPQQPVSLYSVEAGDAVAAPPAASTKSRNNKRNGRRGGGKKRLNRLEMIEDQRQSYTPPMKSRCDYWPTCSNRNCKFRHPVKPCRAGDECSFGNRCMFLHPSDYYE
ncbi:hypothetical protein BJV82DRAFT_4419 [Fennellomyces sp. T-0311]|nr:hypothetical protein BJV82DRAFT_4419 [Fennellomyces sp. T-0311]